jgi:hypothetical protein
VSAKIQTQQERTEKAESRAPFGTPIEEIVAAAVKKEIASLNGSLPRFSADDRDFLIWMTGFTAGANLERDGERGERIFARCREIKERLFSVSQNPT